MDTGRRERRNGRHARVHDRRAGARCCALAGEHERQVGRTHSAEVCLPVYFEGASDGGRWLSGHACQRPIHRAPQRKSLFYARENISAYCHRLPPTTAHRSDFHLGAGYNFLCICIDVNVAPMSETRVGPISGAPVAKCEQLEAASVASLRDSLVRIVQDVRCQVLSYLSVPVLMDLLELKRGLF